jgi:4-amino-4-deoxy-L-arabinose transferase-like glycosyltransferase
VNDEPGAARGRVAAALAWLRAGLRRVPRGAWVCALVGLLSATAWSLVTPVFEIPDEMSHYAYTEYLVQHGRPPRPQRQDRLSTNEQAAIEALELESVRFAPGNPALSSAAESHEVTRLLALNPNRRDGNGAAAEVGGEPWLYYALQAIPYKLAEGGTLLDRLALMRLLSALLGGLTVLFTYLFLREALPGAPWTWTVGALGVAFQPLFGFISGGVNSDALLYTTSAALFFLIARAFRRGLTRPLAVAIGITLAAGTLTKFNFLGLLPGAVLALLVASWRDRRQLDRDLLRLPALALGVAAIPVVLTMAMNGLAWDRPTLGLTTTNFSTSNVHPTIGGALSYGWQFYLFHLSGMRQILAHETDALRDLWLNGFIGRYGWVDTLFPARVYDVALVPIAAVIALCVSALVRERAELRARQLELLAYGLLVAILLAFVALASYDAFLSGGIGSAAQSRYLLPLLPLYGAALALATRGAGRRWMPVVGTAIVVLALAHDVFSQLLVISRFYA